MESLGFSMYNTCHLANSDSFTSSFPIWMTYFMSLIAVAKTSSTMLNKNYESSLSSSWSQRKSFQLFIVEYDVSSVFVIYGLYYVHLCFLYTHSVECFYHKWTLNFVRCFFFLHNPFNIVGFGLLTLCWGFLHLCL